MPALSIRHQLFIDGRFVDAESGETLATLNPHDGMAQEEVFGPFGTVITFKDSAEAVEIANGIDYGLGSGLWTNNLQHAHKVDATCEYTQVRSVGMNVDAQMPPHFKH
ncbi:aldehyde dehydrogenase family protein [Variovorax sp. YR566]|uniref:aldehyde dehydrogenase family protein n=1 Tax=Variovorax sp. YR566 TaxID=3450237 RepID=UPI003F7D791E